jgi:hypothetical protein
MLGGIHLPEVRAVREAVEVELLLAERLADGVHVGDVVGRLQVAEQAPAGPPAVEGVAGCLLEPRSLDPQRRRLVARPRPCGVVGITAECGDAGADAAGIEADPVVGLASAAGHEGAEDAVDEPRAAGTTRVDEHDALVLVIGHGVLDARDGDLDLLAARSLVVERDAEHPALGAERLEGAARLARTPVDRADARSA